MLAELAAKKEALKKGSNPEDQLTVTVDKALQVVAESLEGWPVYNFPVVKLNKDATAVEVLERIVASMKEQNASPQITLPKKVGTIVAAAPTPPKDEETKDWVTENYWKDNVQEVSAQTPSGAKIALAVPKNWTHKAILLAHGYRAPKEENDELINDLNIDEYAISEFIKDGWIVAMSSYRRNGRIVRGAMEDMNELRQYIIDNYGYLSMCLLEGRSMGGAVVTYLSENFPHLYQGAVAIGAALDVIADNEEPIEFTHEPEYPILYLTNQSELGKVEAYIQGVKSKNEKSDHSKDVIRPALWEVWREGHNTVSQSERLAAWKSLINWVQHGTFITVRTQNVFIQGESKAPKPTIQNGAASCKVLNIHPVWKTFYLNILPDTMEQLAVKQGKFFSFTNKRTGASIRVLYTTFPFLCPRDTWMAFDHPDGMLVVEQFTYDFRDHAALAGVIQGDEIVVRAEPEPKRGGPLKKAIVQ